MTREQNSHFLVEIGRLRKAYKDLDLGCFFQPTHQKLIDILVQLNDGKVITPDRVNRVNLFANHPAVIIRILSPELHSYEHDSREHNLFYCKVPKYAKCSRRGYDEFKDEAEEGVWKLTKSTRIINCNLSDGTSLFEEPSSLVVGMVTGAANIRIRLLVESLCLDLFLPCIHRSRIVAFSHGITDSNMVICKIFESADLENAKAVRSVLDGKRELQESLNMNSGHVAEIKLLEAALREERMKRYFACVAKIKLMETALREERMKRYFACVAKIKLMETALREERMKRDSCWWRLKMAYKDLDISCFFQPTHQKLIDILVQLNDGKVITPDRVNRVNLFANHPAIIIRILSPELHSYEHDSREHNLFY
uniref:Uncharacterized protein n=1 Tax=Tanacetum cinerariifolium TaxID=118510 RepID=A0A6L2JU80_TANCI|nr:hypothetical protein [Tanacetum cinerariifolium]